MRRAMVSGMVEYWDFSDTSKITSVGGAVSQVNGQLGVYNLTATGTQKPITGTRTIGTRNALDFDGVDDQMAATITSVNQPTSWLVVYQNDVATGVQQRVFDTANRQLYDAAFNGAADKRTIFGGNLLSGSAGTVNAEQAVIVFNTASSQVWVNGTSDITGDVGTAVTGVTIRVGSDTASAFFNGRLGFIGMISGSISAGDRALWNTYCSRWGL